MRRAGASQISGRASLDGDNAGYAAPDLSLHGPILAALGDLLLMKRRLFILLAIVVIGLGFLAYYLYGGSTVPNGQQPLVRLTDANVSSLKDSFNHSANSVRVIVMLSPT